MIIIDKREKNSLVLAELIERKEELKLEQLAVADYIVGDVAIERKTIQDFVSSMLTKRLLRQLQELKQYPKQLLIVEGIEEYLNYDFGKLNANAIRGMLLSTIFNYQIPLIFTKDYKETAEFLILLARRQKKVKKEISLMAKRRVFNVSEQQQFILESFPGIGPATARKLLNKFGSIKAIVNTSSDDLEKVINKDKVKTLQKIINAKYTS